MPEEPKPEDAGAVWRDQPMENTAVNPEQFANRRAHQLYSSTRSEIVMSIGAALFFAAVMAWRFAPHMNRPQQLGLLAVVAWVLVSLYLFRARIRHGTPARDALAQTGREYYRKELERRRDHLRNEWIWHGPLFLACVVFVATVIDRTIPGRLLSTLPLLILLALWTVFGIVRRRRQAAEIQREIEEIDRP